MGRPVNIILSFFSVFFTIIFRTNCVTTTERPLENVTILPSSYSSNVTTTFHSWYFENSTTTTTAFPYWYVENATTTSKTILVGNVTTRSALASRLRSTASSSSSSSSSAEDQLTPFLLGNATSKGPSTCVTCPPTVCTLSKVSYIRKTIHHNWRVNGLPDYITYLEKFHASFSLHSDVRFNLTSPSDGVWTFMFSRSGHSPYVRNVVASPLDLRVTYKYITNYHSPPRLAFDLWLSAHVEDEYVTLPSQISSFPMSQPVPSSGDLLQEEKFEWTYLFVWSDIQNKLLTLMESGGLESQLVEFKFVINSYLDGNASSADADCASWNSEESSVSPNDPSNHGNHRPHHSSAGNLELNPVNNATWPPFLTQMQALMKDDKYTDLTVKTGDEEFQIHRVIAAYSSPVLAAMIYNLTYQKSESLLDFGEDIGSDVVEELIRYMYTGRVEDIEEIADRLIVAATTYGFPALKKQCESVLIKQVKTENAFSMYELGAEVGSMRLKRRAFNVMKENKSKIVAQSEEFRKLSVHHPDVMYELFLS